MLYAKTRVLNLLEDNAESHAQTLPPKPPPRQTLAYYVYYVNPVCLLTGIAAHSSRC